HLSSAPVTTTWFQPGGNGTQQAVIGTFTFQVAGTYLKRRFGKRMVTIGNLIGRGSIGCDGFTQRIAAIPRESVVGLSSEMREPLYLLDLRPAPQAVANWLDRQRQLGPKEHVFGLSEQFDLAVGEAFDVLFYVDAVSPACDLSPKLSGRVRAPSGIAAQ